MALISPIYSNCWVRYVTNKCTATDRESAMGLNYKMVLDFQYYGISITQIISMIFSEIQFFFLGGGRGALNLVETEIDK